MSKDEWERKERERREAQRKESQERERKAKEEERERERKAKEAAEKEEREEERRRQAKEDERMRVEEEAREKAKADSERMAKEEEARKRREEEAGVTRQQVGDKVQKLQVKPKKSPIVGPQSPKKTKSRIPPNSRTKLSSPESCQSPLAHCESLRTLYIVRGAGHHWGRRWHAWHVPAWIYRPVEQVCSQGRRPPLPRRRRLCKGKATWGGIRSREGGGGGWQGREGEGVVWGGGRRS